MPQIDYAALAAEARAEASVPAAASESDYRALADQVQRTPSMHAPTETEGVTLGDLLDNPKAAIERMGHLLKEDVTDPKTWAAIAAAYVAPKVLGAAPGLANAARSGASRAAVAVGTALDNPAVGVISPRAANAGAALRVIGKVIEPAAVQEIGALRLKLANPALKNNPAARAAIETAIRARGGRL